MLNTTWYWKHYEPLVQVEKKILKRRNVVKLSANTALSEHTSAEVQRQTILVLSRTKRGVFPKYNLSLNEKAICFWLTPERQTTFVNWWYVYRVKTVSHCSLMAPKQNYLARQLTTNKTLAPPPTHIDKITPHTQVLLSQQIKTDTERGICIHLFFCQHVFNTIVVYSYT